MKKQRLQPFENIGDNELRTLTGQKVPSGQPLEFASDHFSLLTGTSVDVPGTDGNGEKRLSPLSSPVRIPSHV